MFAGPPSPVPRHRVIRVLVVDDHPLARAAIVDMVASTAGLVLVGTAHDGREGIALADRVDPDVILMDVSMPGLSGIEATRRLLEADPGTRVLIFSAEARRDVVRAARDAGAAGFVRKGCGESEVIRAIRAVMVGLPVWPMQLDLSF
jgi:DNA-binding NarL/FixJ family response regulator